MVNPTTMDIREEVKELFLKRDFFAKEENTKVAIQTTFQIGITAA